MQVPDLSSFPNTISGFNFTEYLTIFVGLIFALAVGEFFLSLGHLIRHHNHVKVHWEYVLWLIIILDFFLISWFSGWPRLVYIQSSLTNFIVIALPYLVVYIIVSIYFPEIPQHGEVDLKEHFLHNRKLFFLLWGTYIFINALMDVFMPAGLQAFVPTEFIYAALMVIAAFYNKVWFRLILAIIIFSDLISAMIFLK